MQILINCLYVVEVLISLLLAGVVMLQKPKDGGLNVAFGGGMGESLFGAQMGNVLTRTTIIFGSIFLLNTLILSVLVSHNNGASVMEGVKTPAPAPVTQPAELPMPAAAPA
ncbi:MAG: preprotein translocase subunit SecG, partial [Kiritimatiellae bacterium]|nr:preprotein translocase subunit SecG [Kiritimatiellia bacterium]